MKALPQSNIVHYCSRYVRLNRLSYKYHATFIFVTFCNVLSINVAYFVLQGI